MDNPEELIRRDVRNDGAVRFRVTFSSVHGCKRVTIRAKYEALEFTVSGGCMRSKSESRERVVLKERESVIRRLFRIYDSFRLVVLYTLSAEICKNDLHTQDEDLIHFYTDKAVYIDRWPDA